MPQDARECSAALPMPTPDSRSEARSFPFITLTATSASDGTYRLDFGCAPQVAFGSIGMSVAMAGYQERSLPMGRGENLHDYIRQDLDLDPR
jgi:hypothetical protein